MSYQRGMEDIELSNTDVDEVLDDVEITETVYLEEGRIRLSQDQIEIEVGNLAGESLTVSKLRRLTQSYAEMFAKPTEAVPHVETLYPVVESVRFMMEDDFKPQFYYKIDLELDPENNIKGQLLENFLQAYDKLNRDRDAPYLHTDRALWSHMRPYDLSVGKPAERATDVYWKTSGSLATRLVPAVQIDIGHKPDVIDAEYLKENTCPQGKKYIERPQYETTYEGDRTTIVGYVNVVENSKKQEVFSLDAYKEHLAALVEGQKVVVMPNTVVLDYRGRLVYEVDGHVVESNGRSVKIDLEKNINVEGFLLKQVEVFLHRYTPFFVYGSKFDPKFSKPQLAYKSYSFPFKNTRYVLPQTWSEHAMLWSKRLSTYSRVLRHIGYKNMEVGMLPMVNRMAAARQQSSYVPTQHVYRHSPSAFFDFSTNKELLRYYGRPYIHANTYIDSDMHRMVYLRGKPDFGMLYALGMRWKGPGQDRLSVLLRQAKERLSRLSVEAPTTRKPRLLKAYGSLVALNNDNGKALYADKDLDKTRYYLKDRTDLKGKELKAFLIKEYDTDEYEAESILEGRCRVREGDMATLEFAGHKGTFRWALVGKEYMWVKTTQAACGPELPTADDLSKDKTMVIDTYDSICKSASKAKEHWDYLVAVGAITLLEGALEEEEPVNIEEELAIHVQIAEGLDELRRPNTNAMYGYVDKVAYEEYFGTDNLDNMFMNFAFDDAPRAMNPLAARQEEPRSIVDILCKVLEINGMDDAIKRYIEDKAELKHPDSDMQVEIEKLNSGIAKLLHTYSGKGEKVLKEMKAKLEAKKAEKVEVIQKKHYYDKTALCASLVTLMVMINHPHILIKKLLPTCVRTFSHVGYPMLPEDSPRSLTRYIACVLRALASPRDPRFALFSDIDDNNRALVIKTKQILVEDLQLRSLIEKKKIEDMGVPEREDITYNVLNTFFRPCFDFAHASYSDPAIRLVKHIHGVIKSSRATRYNIVNMPLISNTCCIELLEKKTNFYDYLRGEEMSGLHRALSKRRAEDRSWSLFMKTKERQHEELFSKKTISVEAGLVERPVERRVLSESVHDWDTVVQETKDTWDTIQELVGPLDMQIAKLYINIEDLKDVPRLRSCLFSYTRGVFASTVSKIANGFRYGRKQKFDKADPFVLLLEASDGAPGLASLSVALQGFLEGLPSGRDTDSSIHDIIRQSNKMCRFMLDSMWILSSGSPVPEGGYTKNQLYTSIGSSAHGKTATDLVRLLASRLSDHTSANYFDVSDIKKQVEVLRERRKEEIMAKYSRDIEERNQQKILKNIGLGLEAAMPSVVLPTGEDVIMDDPMPEADVPVVAPAEAEYGDYVEAAGENADGDVDYDGYD